MLVIFACKTCTRCGIPSNTEERYSEWCGLLRLTATQKRRPHCGSLTWVTITNTGSGSPRRHGIAGLEVIRRNLDRDRILTSNCRHDELVGPSAFEQVHARLRSEYVRLALRSDSCYRAAGSPPNAGGPLALQVCLVRVYARPPSRCPLAGVFMR